MRILQSFINLRVRLWYRIDQWFFSYQPAEDVKQDDILQITRQLRNAIEQRRNRLGSNSDPHGIINGIELAIAYSELVVKEGMKLTDRELHWYYGGYHLDFMIGERDEEIAALYNSLKKMLKIPPPYWQRNIYGRQYPS